MKYAFIKQEQKNYPVNLLCLTVGISSSGYYAWKQRCVGRRSHRPQELQSKIVALFAEKRSMYGSPRIYRELKDRGVSTSKASVEKIMRENGLRALARRKFRATTDSRHDLPVLPNVLDRDFNVGHRHERWCGDITYLRTLDGWLYLAAVIDIGTRKVVGWSMSDRMSKQLVLSALDMAWKREHPMRGVLFHSDRGSQYASRAFRKRLQRYGMIQSMSRRANCWDNAVAESFFHSLKTESYLPYEVLTKEQTRVQIFHYVEVFYNRQRLHSSLGYKSPECYTQHLAQLSA